MREDTAGDPMGKHGLWTGKRLRSISSELAHLGLRVCPNTVRRLLEEIDYALHANRKSLCANGSPLRDQQFGLLNHQRAEFLRSGYPRYGLLVLEHVLIPLHILKESQMLNIQSSSVMHRSLEMQVFEWPQESVPHVSVVQELPAVPMHESLD